MITDLLPKAVATVYYDPDFLDALDKVLDTLEFEYRNVSHHDLYVFENDFYGLLKHIKIPVNLHWVTLRLNGYSSPIEFKTEVPMIKLISPDALAKFRRRYNSTKKRQPGIA